MRRRDAYARRRWEMYARRARDVYTRADARQAPRSNGGAIERRPEYGQIDTVQYRAGLGDDLIQAEVFEVSVLKPRARGDHDAVVLDVELLDESAHVFGDLDRRFNDERRVDQWKLARTQCGNQRRHAQVTCRVARGIGRGDIRRGRNGEDRHRWNRLDLRRLDRRCRDQRWLGRLRGRDGRFDGRLVCVDRGQCLDEVLKHDECPVGLVVDSGHSHHRWPLQRQAACFVNEALPARCLPIAQELKSDHVAERLIESAPDLGAFIAAMEGREAVATCDELPLLAAFGGGNDRLRALHCISNGALGASSSATIRLGEYAGTSARARASFGSRVRRHGD